MSDQKKLAILASQGTLDFAYPPFILASAAAAMGWDVLVFFTFYGLPLLKKDIKATATPLGNTAMPMKMPFGSKGFQNIDWPIPTVLQTVPGFEAMTTGLLKKTFKNKGVATVQELRDMCVDLDVNLTACQMTMEVFGFTQDEFIDGCGYGGAAAWLEYAADADVSLFI